MTTPNTLDERWVKEIEGFIQSTAISSVLMSAFSQIREDERAKVIGDVREKLNKMYVEDIKKYPECTWNSAVDDVKNLLPQPRRMVATLQVKINT